MDPELAKTLVTHGVALLGGGLGGAVLGWLGHRNRERATQEEQARGRLASLRYDAVAACARAVSDYLTYQRMNLLPPEQRDPIFEATGDVPRKILQAVYTVTSNVLLVPESLREPLTAFLVTASDPKLPGERLQEAGDRLAKELETYLPKLPRRRVRHRTR